MKAHDETRCCGIVGIGCAHERNRTGRCGEAMAGVTQRGDEGGEHRQQPQSSDTVNCSG